MLLKKTKRLIERISSYFLGWFTMDIGIDLGTCTTLISLRNKGIVLNEPSVVAIRKGTNTVLSNGDAVGSVAHERLGKTPPSIVDIRLLRNDVIGEFHAT